MSDAAEFRRNHVDLNDYLARHCALVADTPAYLIYTSCASLEHGG